jgi:ribonuclease HI
MIKNMIKMEQMNSAKIFPTMNYVMRFDGASKGNPGLAGAGAVIYKDGDELWSGYSFVGDHETNNVAEYNGLILGLTKALEFNIKNLLVEGDSQLVINQMKGEYKVNSNNLMKMYNTAKMLEQSFDKIIYNHIYREKNKKADQLSNLAISFYGHKI